MNEKRYRKNIVLTVGVLGKFKIHSMDQVSEDSDEGMPASWTPNCFSWAANTQNGIQLPLH